MTISKRQLVILTCILVLLAIPLLAMQFSSEVQWSSFDFLVAGILLFALGFSIDLAIRKAKAANTKYLAITAIIILFLLIWAELAVGIFGSPLAGS